MTAETPGWTREEIARRVAMDIPDGSIVNLGIGLPEKIAAQLPPDREVLFHTENGLLGMGPFPSDQDSDPELVNAGKQMVTAIPGASFFHHADSFAMIRGGHIDICVLGILQVAENGDLANWSTGAGIPSVGGAMDLVVGAKRIFALSRHCTRDGSPKIVAECSYPLTGAGNVDRIYTDLGVMAVTGSGLVLEECAPGVDFAFIQARTGCALARGLL